MAGVAVTRKAMVFKALGPVSGPGGTGWWRLGRDALALRLRVESWPLHPAGPLDADVFHVRIWTNDAGRDDGAREPFYQALDEAEVGVQRRTVSDLDEFIKMEWWATGQGLWSLGIKAELISA